jgi:biopolymer transport protein ExbD
LSYYDSHKKKKKKTDKETIVAVVSILSVVGVILSILSIVISAINTHPTSTITTSAAADNNNNNNTNSPRAVAITKEEKSIVPLDQIVSGGPPPDGIPSIDNPKFISVQEASKFLKDSELVLGLNINGDVRAYPLQILVWHEIVNDNVGAVPVAITYCPLCFTNQVFNRTIDERVVAEFGTSGKLYNSNLV